MRQKKRNGAIGPDEALGAIVERTRDTIRAHGLASSDTPVVLMVSGGSDSTALAYLGRALADRGAIGPLAMLHVNHGIRGAASDGDQAFVEKLATMLDIPLFTCAVNVPALAEMEGENLEAVARRERYQAAHQALESLCRHASAPLSDGRIFTAHTQDDRVENFYMRSIVGTGPGGFRAMRYLNGQVARPCLDLSRQDLRDYLAARWEAGLPVLVDDTAEQPVARPMANSEETLASEKAAGSEQEALGGNQAEAGASSANTLAKRPHPPLWREDATNAHTDLFRGYVRHEIVPRAKARNGRLLDTLTRTMNLIADEDDYLDELARTLVDEHVSWLEGESEPTATGPSCVFAPAFGQAALPLRRRAAAIVLSQMLGPEARIEAATIEKLLSAWVDGAPISGYKANVQGDLAISANKRGVRLEPMEAYRTRRKRK